MAGDSAGRSVVFGAPTPPSGARRHWHGGLASRSWAYCGFALTRSAARRCGGAGFSGRLMPAGTYFFTYGLPAASSRCLAKVRKRPLVSVRCSVPPCASAIRATDAAGESSASRLKHCRTARRKAKPTPMALGCCVGCATKKESEEVAGNAIPRSRLSSERKIAHSRAGSLCPYFDIQ